MSVMRIKTASENAEVDYSLQQLLNTPNGLERLATEKLPPFIRDTRDYEAFARKILFVHQIVEADTTLFNGEPYVYYPKDLKSHAAFYGADGEVPQLMVEGDGVYAGVFTVASDDVTMNIKRLMVQKYNYIERIRELSGQAMGMAEDRRLVKMIENLIIGANLATPNYPSQVVKVAYDQSAVAGVNFKGLTKNSLVDLKKTISQHDIPCQAFVMSPIVQDDILKWGEAELDQLSMREILETGVRYVLWGSIKIVTSRAIPTNRVYSFADKEFVGRMPVLKDITTKLTETANKLEKGLFVYEFVGMYLASHKAVGILVFTDINGGAVDPDMLNENVVMPELGLTGMGN